MGPFSSSKITEAVFGETVEVLEVKDSWIHIKQKDDYKSWLKSFYGTFEENPIECDYIVIDKHPLLFGNKIFKKNQSYKTINGGSKISFPTWIIEARKHY